MNIAPRLEMKTKDKDVRFPAVVEPKYDGEFNVYFNGKLINRHGRVRANTAITDTLLSIFGSDCVLYGELIKEGGQAGDIFKLNSDKDNPTCYMVFDVLHYQGEDLTKHPLMERKTLLSQIWDTLPDGAVWNTCTGDFNVDIVLGTKVHTHQELWREYQQATKSGYEGVVVKPLNSVLPVTSWVKLKTEFTSDLRVYKVCQDQERIEVEHDVYNEAGDYLFNVVTGVKCVDKYKKDIKVGDIVEVKYNQILGSGSLRHPVYVRKRDDKTRGDSITVRRGGDESEDEQSE